MNFNFAILTENVRVNSGGFRLIRGPKTDSAAQWFIIGTYLNLDHHGTRNDSQTRVYVTCQKKRKRGSNPDISHEINSPRDIHLTTASMGFDIEK